MDWIKWANEIHENAKAHGWWNEERTAAEIVCLIHSELSEALEEYRNNRPMVYALILEDDGGFEAAEPRLTEDMDEIRLGRLKPEGIAVDLVDAVIRILDWFGACASDELPDLDNEFNGLDPEERVWDLPRLLAECHQIIADAWNCGTIDNEDLSAAVIYIRDWLDAKGYDLEKIMELKHEYNKGRPYRHGGKRI